MSRVEKNKESKLRRKILLYPVIAFVLMAIMLIAVIDYRINNTIGTGGIKIVGVRMNDSRVALNILNEDVASVDFEFVKRDIMRLKTRVFDYANQFQNMTREVIKQY